MELTSWVFATANSCEKIIQPLLSRFAVLEISEYAFKEFTEIALAKLAKERVDERLARVIAEKVWNELGSRDIRDVIKIARLSGSSDEVHYVVKMLNKQERLGGMNNS
jgi:Holliday junction DNA helicase RuvB